MGGEAAGDARLAQLAGRGLDLGPSLRCLFVVEPRGTKQVLVVVEDRGRGIERERQQIARRIRIIARYDRHQLEHRIDRAPRRHHGGGRDLVYLHDGRLGMGAHREDRRRDGFRIAALGSGDDPVVGLRPVEIGHQSVERVAKLAGHGVPEFRLGFGPGGGWRQRQQHPRDKRTGERRAVPCCEGSWIGLRRIASGLKLQIHGKIQLCPVKRLQSVLHSFDISSNERFLH